MFWHGGGTPAEPPSREGGRGTSRMLSLEASMSRPPAGRPGADVPQEGGAAHAHQGALSSSCCSCAASSLPLGEAAASILGAFPERASGGGL